MRSHVQYESPVHGALRPPLTALLSQVLVAFIIEFDNEFEQRAQHRTTIGTGKGVAGPWLASMAAWYFMQLVGEEGVTVRELERRARAVTLPLLGMQRWGYVDIAPDPADKRPKPPQRDWLILPKPKGSQAREIWRPLFGVIEDRWQARFGAEAISSLRSALSAIVEEFNFELPDFLPVLGYGLFSSVVVEPKATAAVTAVAVRPSLPTLLAKVILAISLDFEREWPLSLAVYLNTLRVLNEHGVRQRDLPLLAGVSKEAIGFTLSFLTKRGYVEVVPDSGMPKTKLARLTEKGAEAKLVCQQRLIEVEALFGNLYGRERIEQLRDALAALLNRKEAGQSLLGRGLIPQPDAWRSSKAYIAQTLALVEDPAASLPHFPMVLHRGGFPDGS